MICASFARGLAGARGGGLYRRIGEVFVIAAVGPEAESNPRAFKRALTDAARRLQEVEND
jgi:hypothetical protein